MNLEHFYENSFSTSCDGILQLIRGNSRVISPSEKQFSIQIGFEKQLAKGFISFCLANCFSNPI